jgi:hypothetical protein
MIGALTVDDVQRSISRARTSLEAAAEEVIWQIENEVWAVLGYASWDVMREAVYGGAAFMVPTATRPELVARLRGLGMSQREIARTAGISQSQAQRDVTQMGHPDPEPDSCFVDPSDGLSGLREILRSTDRLLANYYAEPSDHCLSEIEAWLGRHERKARRTRKGL